MKLSRCSFDLGGERMSGKSPAFISLFFRKRKEPVRKPEYLFGINRGTINLGGCQNEANNEIKLAPARGAENIKL